MMSKVIRGAGVFSLPTCAETTAKNQRGDINHTSPTRHNQRHIYNSGMNKEKWSNLTQAIKNGDPIDWEAFGSSNHRVKLVGPQGKLKGALERDERYSADIPYGWDFDGTPTMQILGREAWLGECGWSLWVKGDIPLLAESGPEPVTADALPLGTCFLDMEGYLGFLFEDEKGQKLVRSFRASVSTPAEKVEVQRAYGVGTFRYEGQEEG